MEQENAKIQVELAQVRTQLLEKEAALDSRDLQVKSQKSYIKFKDAFIEQLKEALLLAHNRQFAKVTESLRSLQRELFDDVEGATLTWVDWFNNRRILQPIGDVPPAEYELMYYQSPESSEAA